MEGLSANEIKAKIKRLSNGNFWYWVRYKTGLNPVGERREGRQIVDVYSKDSVEKIKKVMALTKRGKL